MSYCLLTCFSKHLRVSMDQKIGLIRERNMKQDPHLAADMQLAAHQADTAQRKRQEIAEAALSETRQTGNLAQSQGIWTRMRAQDDPGSAAMKRTSQARLLKPDEHRQPQELQSDGIDDNEQTEHRPRRPQESQSQRNLRSGKPKTRSPTPPPPSRWTETNPNWVEDRSYNIPLIYERTTINATDIERLDEGQFLNDEIISFYAKYLHKKLEARNEQVAKKVYVFSSFFWEKLRSSGYEGVKNWTTKIDVSSFDYIIVPINQSAHWYLAIICNPGALLPEGNAGRDGDSVHPAAAHPAAAGQEGHHEMSIEDDADTKVERVTMGLADMSIAELQLDGSATIDLEDPEAASSAKKMKQAKKGPRLRKYNAKDPRVIVLDSLDGAHTNVATTLKNYLKKEIKQRKDVDIELPLQFGMAAKDIPFQTNFTDCGVYLLGYLEEFMKDPYEFTGKILQHESRTWDVNASAMRDKIRELIFDLQSRYQREIRQQKRERMLASKRQKARSKTPPAVSQTSSPKITSKGTVQKSSLAGSLIPDPHQQTPARAPSSPTRQLEAAEVLNQRSATVSPPPLQRKQACSRQAEAKSSHPPKGDLEAADVKDSLIVNLTQSVESRDSACLQQQHTSSSQTVTKTSPVSESSLSFDSGSGPLDVNTSMVVHPNRSMESKKVRSSHPEQVRSNQRVAESGRMVESSASSASQFATANIASTLGDPIKGVESENTQDTADQELTPRPSKPIESVEITGPVEPKPPSSSDSPTPQRTPQPSEPPRFPDDNYDERSFLEPIRSSSSISSRPGSPSTTSKIASRGHNDRSGALSTKTSARNTIPRQAGERSRFWSPERQPSTAKAPSRRDASSPHIAVPSSSTEGEKMARDKVFGKRSKKSHEEKIGRPKAKNHGDDKRSKSNYTIDLTVD